MKFTEGILINRPVAEVFAYVADFSTHPKWADAVRIDILTDGPMGAGTRMHSVDKFMGREFGMESAITMYEPPRRMGYKIPSMAAEAMQIQARKTMRQSLAKLKTVLENDRNPS